MKIFRGLLYLFLDRLRNDEKKILDEVHLYLLCPFFNPQSSIGNDMEKLLS